MVSLAGREIRWTAPRLAMGFGYLERVSAMKISSMTRIALILTASLGLSSVAAALDDQSSDSTRESVIRESVVKITANLRYPDILHPWTKQSPREASGNGSGHRRQANSDQRPHGALRQPAYRWRASSPATSSAATVEAVSPGMDLAVLKLDDESFFEKRPPLCPGRRRCPRSRRP